MRQRIDLEDIFGEATRDELDRLAGVINTRSVYLVCHTYQRYVRAGHTPTLDEPGFLSWRPADGEQLAAQAIASFRS